MTFRPDPKKYREPKQKKGLKQKFPEPTGELALFKKIHAALNGKSELTDKYLPFNVKHFIHCLSKGSREDLRLEAGNIVHGEYRAHWLYDNSIKSELLKEFPRATLIYERKANMKPKRKAKFNAIFTPL